MKGLIVSEIGQIQLVHDIPEPVMGEYDALVQVLGCGVCNSTDIKVRDGKFKGLTRYPCVLGHEAVGRVIAVGAKVSKYHIGDVVLRPKNRATEKYGTGWGGFAEYALAVDDDAMRRDGVAEVPDKHRVEQVLPPDIDPYLGVMLITHKEVYGALMHMGMGAGKSVVINGCGPVGQTILRFSLMMGAEKIIVSDPDEERLTRASKMGSVLCVNPVKQSLLQTIHQHYPEGVDLFIDAVGINALIQTGTKAVKKDGSICVYGVSPISQMQLDWSEAPTNWNIRFMQVSPFPAQAACHDTLVQAVREGKLRLEDDVTHILPIEEYQKAFDLVESHQANKIVLTFIPQQTKE